MGQLVSVIKSDQTIHFVVAVPNFKKASEILKAVIPGDAKVEASGNVSKALLARLKLAPGQFSEVWERRSSISTSEPPSRAAEYRRLAAECIEVSERMSLREDRSRMMEMAQRWLDLA
jgi:hypothetical protein